MRLGDIKKSRKQLLGCYEWRAAILTVLAALPLIAASPVRAEQVGGEAGSTIAVAEPLSVTVQQNLSFGRLEAQDGSSLSYAVIDPSATTWPRTGSGVKLLPGGGEGPLIALISGEPNRSYRIELPDLVLASPGQFKVTGLNIVSATSGNIPIYGIGHLDASGQDQIRIGGVLLLDQSAALDIYTALVPITVLYD